NADGSWGYQGQGQHWADSMTCAGLLGLAVGQGILQEGSPRPDVVQAPDIARGLAYLGRVIDKEGSPGKAALSRKMGRHLVHANARGDLYFLWSLERVGVIYDLSRIEGKDWYAWGAPMIVDHQNADGSWSDTFPGIVDTSFALLFLRRVNVATDLTSKLKLLSKPHQEEAGSGIPSTPEDRQEVSTTPGGNAPKGKTWELKARGGKDK
ncbi:MAG: hypothetical protein JO112_08945, partial [Planctomycetes bacterium]|nr:hypothetical protein [Planctomycetota bacterium]